MTMTPGMAGLPPLPEGFERKRLVCAWCPPNLSPDDRPRFPLPIADVIAWLLRHHRCEERAARARVIVGAGGV